MVYMPLEELLPKADYNSYSLVTLVSKRALELANGASKLVDSAANEKLVTTSLREVRLGKVVLDRVAEKFAPVQS